MPGIGIGVGIWMRGGTFSGGEPPAVPQWVASATKDDTLIWVDTERWRDSIDGFSAGFSGGFG